MKKVKYGIVGVGNMGKMHLTNLHTRIKAAEVVAICDATEDYVKKIQEDFNVPHGYTDYDEMLKNPEVEAVVIATGAAMHKEQAIKACEAGKHVFCEKPLAKTIEDCKEVEAAVEKNKGKAFTVGYMRRYDPSYMAAKEKIRNGEIGKPIHVKATSLDPDTVLDNHLEGVKKGIYVPWFIEMGAHDTDLVRWFLEGEPVECFATGGAYVCEELADYDDYDNGFSLSTFDNGTSATIHVGRTHTNAHISTEIVGTKGTLVVSAIPRKNYLGQFTKEGYVEEMQDSFLARWSEAFYNEMDNLTNCILEGRQPEITAKDGTAGLEFCLKLHEAYLKNKK